MFIQVSIMIILCLTPILCAGLKPQDIVEFFNEVKKQAKKIESSFMDILEKPQVTVG